MPLSSVSDISKACAFLRSVCGLNSLSEFHVLKRLAGCRATQNRWSRQDGNVFPSSAPSHRDHSHAYFSYTIGWTIQLSAVASLTPHGLQYMGMIRHELRLSCHSRVDLNAGTSTHNCGTAYRLLKKLMHLFPRHNMSCRPPVPLLFLYCTHVPRTTAPNTLSMIQSRSRWANSFS